MWKYDFLKNKIPAGDHVGHDSLRWLIEKCRLQNSLTVNKNINK